MKYYLFILFPFFMACEDSITLDVAKVSSIHYAFHDSSVPPQYHRSYDIKISRTDAHVTVDSYGDELANENYELSSEQFSDLINTINQSNLVSGAIKAEEGCVGGTSESLVINESNAQVYKGTIDNCGGTAIPATFGDIKTVVKVIKALVPNLAELRK